MARSNDDREAVDRAFADLVAGYHLTSDRPDPLPERTEPSATVNEAESRTWAEDHPLFAYEEPRAEPEPTEVEERYEPPAPPPLPRPAWPVLIGWLGMGYAVLVVLGVVVGVELPGWAGWAAMVGFVVGFGILVARLPRSRPPDAGDGAVL